MKYSGYAFLYIGCCFEQFEDNIKAFEAYKQATYFLGKSSITGNPFKSMNIVNINNSCNFFAEDVFEKLKLQFEREKIERMQMQNKLEKLKKLQKYQLLQNEKQFKLKLVANGYIGDPFKYNKLEEKIEKSLFPSSVRNVMEKIDDELISFVFTDFNSTNNNQIKKAKNRMSLNTKKMISRFELYNILMSKDFRDFVMRTKKLQFNNPRKGSESISIIQRYLNKKMEIRVDYKPRNLTHKKSLRLVDRSNKKYNTNVKNQNLGNEVVNTMTFHSTCLTSHRDEETETKIRLPKNRQNYNNTRKVKIKIKNPPDNEKEKELPISLIAGSYHPSPSFRLSSSTKNKCFSTKKTKKNINELECDFERKNFDKNLMNKNYLKKYAYYETLSNKEIKMQKAFLDFRGNNSLYNSKKFLDDKENRLITTEEINNKFLAISEAVKENTKVIVKDDEFEMIKDTFSSGEDSKVGIKVRSAMSKVINKYILERKKKLIKKKIILDSEEVKLANEKNILELNYAIKNINNNISNVRSLAGNSLSDRIYN